MLEIGSEEEEKAAPDGETQAGEEHSRFTSDELETLWVTACARPSAVQKGPDRVG